LPFTGQEYAREATIEIFLSLEGIENINAGSRIILFTWRHKADRRVLKTKPRNDPTAKTTSIFSTRSPHRPNPIGIHFVTVI
jgi:L-fuculose-phosphate aldolase